MALESSGTGTSGTGRASQCTHCLVLVRPETLTTDGQCTDRARCEQWKEQRQAMVDEFEQIGPSPLWLLYEDWLHRQKLARRQETGSCQICGKDVPYGKTAKAKYCDAACKKIGHANTARESARRKAKDKKGGK